MIKSEPGTKEHSRKESISSQAYKQESKHAGIQAAEESIEAVKNEEIPLKPIIFQTERFRTPEEILNDLVMPLKPRIESPKMPDLEEVTVED